MRTLKYFLATVSLIGLCALPLQAQAEQKIGVVDMRAVISSSKQAKEIMEKLKTEFKGREEKIIAADKTLKDKTEKLQRNAAVMSAADKEKLEKEILNGQRDIQRMQAEFREDAAMRQQQETKKLMDKVNAVIKDIAKKENYDLIIYQDAAPYVAKQIDLTEKIVKAVSA